MKPILCGIVLVIALPVYGASWESSQTQEWLRPYLDPEYVPTQGPDKDLPAFVRDSIRQIGEALPAKLSAPVQRPRRILVLTRGLYGGVHVPGAAGMLILLRESAKKYGGLELTELYTDDGIDEKMLGTFDAVVLNNVGRLDNKQNAAFYNSILPAYVRHGGGLFVNHSVVHLLMDQQDAEFNRLLGGFTSAGHVHPKRHGSPFPVERPEPAHPLAAAFRGPAQLYKLQFSWLDNNVRRYYAAQFEAPQQLADELNLLHPESNKDGAARVVLRVGKEAADRFPAGSSDFVRALIWIKQYGKGRVFYTQIGHNLAVYSVPCIARSMLDGLQYAAGDLPTGGSSK